SQPAPGWPCPASAPPPSPAPRTAPAASAIRGCPRRPRSTRTAPRPAARARLCGSRKHNSAKSAGDRAARGSSTAGSNVVAGGAAAVALGQVVVEQRSEPVVVVALQQLGHGGEGVDLGLHVRQVR